MNKKDERGIMIRNKARLLQRGYTKRGIDYNEVFAPIARIEAIRLFLAYASFKDFIVYQMDVKSAFLYGKIEEEVYVCQPLGFEDLEFPDRVYKVEKALYGLHQAPRAWPDIMFVVCACARFQVIPKVSHLHAVKRIFRYLKGQPKLGLWYPKDSPFDLEAYTDSDYAGASLDKKSTTGEKPKESDEFEGIIDFLNASSIRYTLTVNLTIYTLCIKQFWATAKEKTVNEEVQIQALVDGKKVIITETTDTHRPITDEAANAEHVPTHSNDPLFSGEDRLKLNELMELCTKLSERVLDLENTKTSQAAEITKLKERVKKLERRNKSRTSGLKRLRKVGRSAQVVSSEDEGLGAQEDASKQGRKIADLDADAEVTLVDEAQGRIDDYLMFDTGVFDEQEVEIEKAVSTAEVTTVSATTIIDELTLAQTLIKIKAAKPKAVTTDATTTTTAVTRPKARGVVVQEPSEFRTTTSSSQISQAKDKGKAKMIEPEKPLKKKDQILIDEEIAQKLQAQLNAELEEEEKLAKQREEDANIAEWDNVQAMIDADYELAARLQAQEQEELTVEEKSKLFVELMDKRKKHFARLRAEEQRRKPPTKAQKRNQMCTYLKNMAGFTHSQLKNKSFDEVQKAFDKTMGWIDSFVSMDSEVVKGGKEKDEGSVTRAEESSSKRAGTELEQERIKKQKIDDDQEEAEMKKHMEIVVDEEEIAVDAIPLATKPLIIVDWKIIKEGKMGYFQLIRADGSSRRYSSMIKILQNIDREDLETLWKLVKAKHGNTRPEEAYERVLWGDLKVMFEPDIESDVWRNLQGHKKRRKMYPLTPATITAMLNKKLQADHWNEMCYQLLKLMTKLVKNPGSV
ncbi:putative ribonuclease H-like domain-containing protein [Tanacetum coccineum]